MSIWIAAAAALAAQAGAIPAPEEAGKAAVRTCVSREEAARPVGSLTLAERRALIACAQRVAAAVLAEHLPMRVDELTTLIAVTADGIDLTYKYRVSAGRPAFRDGFDANLARSVCADRGRATVISAGGAYRYIWHDTSGRVVHRLTIDTCGEAAAEPQPVA
ncbi:MAG TPA: hypothetical protein VF552_10815 [Allosphingosinicella sp.]